MSSPALFLSLLNGQLKAVSVRRGSVVGNWERAEPLVDFEALSSLLQEAASKTGAAGKQVTMVLADARLSDHFVELPQVRGVTLTRLLERTAHRMKTFQGDVAWSSQPAIPSKKGNSALLHLCPKPVLDQLLQSCHLANLELVRLLPATALLASHLKSLPLQKDDVVLLAAETGRSIVLVVGRKDGRVCLGRVLPISWSAAPERVWTDVARSIGFAEQQSPVTVGSVWLFGEDAEAQVPAAQGAVKVPVKVSPVPYSPFYWAEQAARLPEKEDGNLVSMEIRQAPKRQRFMTFTAALILLLLLVSLGAAGAIEYFRRSELKGLEQVNQQIKKVSQEKAELEKTYAELESMRKTTALIEAELPPAAEWFLAYLGQVTPRELAITQLQVVRTNNEWAVSIDGTAESRTNLTEQFEAFCDKLANSSFKMTITESDLGVTPPPPGTPPPTTIQNVSGRVTRALRPDSKLPPNTFAIKGVMR